MSFKNFHEFSWKIPRLLLILHRYYACPNQKSKSYFRWKCQLALVLVNFWSKNILSSFQKCNFIFNITLKKSLKQNLRLKLLNLKQKKKMWDNQRIQLIFVEDSEVPEHLIRILTHVYTTCQLGMSRLFFRFKFNSLSRRFYFNDFLG